MELHATGLAAERNGRVVFQALSFVARPGALVALKGPNGSGKSTLLRVIAGLLPAAQGLVELKPMADTPLRQHCHYVGHLDALKQQMSVRQNLQFWAKIFGGGEIDGALAAFGLSTLADDLVQLLSAGQRRRLALARLLVAPRPIWLLDEPMTALDADSQNSLVAVIESHLKSGGMVLAALHDDGGLIPDQQVTLGPQ